MEKILIRHLDLQAPRGHVSIHSWPIKDAQEEFIDSCIKEGGRMNVRKKEGRSMRRNNYLPVTRDPQFRGASVSLHLASVRPVTMVRVLREVQTERGRGEPGGGRQHLSLQEPAGGSAQMQQPCSQGAQWEGKTETLNWVIQAPQTLECSPQPSMSHCCPCQAPRLPASAPLSCKCLHLPRGLLFTQPTPSPLQGLKLDATSCKKPSW